MTTEGCEESFSIGFGLGQLKCDIRDGHAGPHKDVKENDAVWWQKELTRKRDE